jgi:hypothetical protein
MKELTPDVFEFLLELYGLIEQVDRTRCSPASRKLFEQFIRLASRELDPENGETMILRKTLDGKGFIRMARHPELSPESIHVSILQDLKPSVDYSWVSDDRVKSKLELDNLLMEYSIITIFSETKIPLEWKLKFCVHAHFQLEKLFLFCFERMGHVPRKPEKSIHKDRKDKIYKERSASNLEDIYRKISNRGNNDKERDLGLIKSMRLLRNSYIHRDDYDMQDHYKFADIEAPENIRKALENVSIDMRAILEDHDLNTR